MSDPIIEADVKHITNEAMQSNEGLIILQRLQRELLNKLDKYSPGVNRAGSYSNRNDYDIPEMEEHHNGEWVRLYEVMDIIKNFRG